MKNNLYKYKWGVLIHTFINQTIINIKIDCDLNVKN